MAEPIVQNDLGDDIFTWKHYNDAGLIVEHLCDTAWRASQIKFERLQTKDRTQNSIVIVLK